MNNVRDADVERVELFAAAELAEGQVRRFDTNLRRPIAIYRVKGQVYATDDYCTHGKASLADGDLVGYDIVCPFHGGAFDIRTGKVTRPPCAREIKVHNVREIGGTLYLIKGE